MALSAVSVQQLGANARRLMNRTRIIKWNEVLVRRKGRNRSFPEGHDMATQSHRRAPGTGIVCKSPWELVSARLYI